MAEEPRDLKPEVRLAERRFEYLFRLFELYTTVQVEADTIYHNRTSIITLTEGLLFLGFQSLIQKGSPTIRFLAIGIAAVGLVLSVFWLLYEQRNAIYFLGRGKVLEDLEAELTRQANETQASFRSFWTEVPNWVKKNAAWYQRVSGPLIIRVLVPLLFVVSWLILLVATPFVFRPDQLVPSQAVERLTTSPKSEAENPSQSPSP
jgi:hypothetical protein